MSVPTSEPVDGRVLLGLFKSESEPARRAGSKTAATSQAIDLGMKLDSEEELKEKLRALGYLG